MGADGVELDVMLCADANMGMTAANARKYVTGAADAGLLFLFGQDGLGTGQRLQNQVINLDTDAMNTLHQVLY